MASKEISPLNTTHLYYADTELLSNTAEVIGEYSVEINGSQLLAIVLDQTVMHPQGGTLRERERERERLREREREREREKKREKVCILIVILKCIPFVQRR